MENLLPLKINQNLLGLAFNITALGFAEFYHLKWLFGVSLTLTIIFSISNIYTLIKYTRNYRQNDKKE